MSDKSAIEWCDATWNPVRGCTKVSPGCAHCYAETFAERFRGVKGHPYEQGFDLRLVPEKLEDPLRRQKPTTYFVNSMSDLFQDGVPNSYIRKVFDVMAQARRHTFQVLTKQPERMRALLPTFAARHTARDGSGWPLPNVWLGVSVENQHFANERIPLLLQTPAAIRFISAEPLLGPIGIEPWLGADRKTQGDSVCRDGVNRSDGNGAGPLDSSSTRNSQPRLDWVIVGGESGPGARPFRVQWARAILAQCKAAGVPVFVKQLGAVPLVPAGRLRHWEWRDIKRPEDKRFTAHGVDRTMWRVHLADRKGGDMAEWPQDLRVREFPT